MSTTCSNTIIVRLVEHNARIHNINKKGFQYYNSSISSMKSYRYSLTETRSNTIIVRLVAVSLDNILVMSTGSNTIIVRLVDKVVGKTAVYVKSSNTIIVRLVAF